MPPSLVLTEAEFGARPDGQPAPFCCALILCVPMSCEAVRKLIDTAMATLLLAC